MKDTKKWIVVQVRDADGRNSRAISINGLSVNETFSTIVFVLRSLEKSDSINLRLYKTNSFTVSKGNKPKHEVSYMEKNNTVIQKLKMLEEGLDNEEDFK